MRAWYSVATDRDLVAAQTPPGLVGPAYLLEQGRVRPVPPEPRPEVVLRLADPPPDGAARGELEAEPVLVVVDGVVALVAVGAPQVEDGDRPEVALAVPAGNVIRGVAALSSHGGDTGKLGGVRWPYSTPRVEVGHRGRVP